MNKINAITVPQGRNFINRRLQPTDRRTYRSNKPCKGDTWGKCVEAQSVLPSVGMTRRWGGYLQGIPAFAGMTRRWQF
jgi:hypothetical protein